MPYERNIFAKQCRAFRLDYIQPQRTDIFRCISVSVLNTAHLTKELFTTAFAYFLAAVASFRSVGRGYKVDRNTFSFGFVSNVALQLIERPTVMQTALRFPQSLVCTITDSFQIFNSNGFVFQFSFGNNCFDNGMVLNLYRSPFPSTKPFQNAFSILSAFGLKRTAGRPRTYFLSMRAKAIQFSTGKCFSTIGSSNIIYSQVHANTIIKFLLLFMRNITGLKQVKFSFHISQIGFTLCIFEQFSMMFSGDKRNLLPACYSPNRGNRTFIGKYSGIIGNRTVFAKLSQPLTVKLIAVTNFCYAANYCLCTKINVPLMV